MKRRTFLLGAGALAVGAGVLARPDDKGRAYSSYFSELNELLKSEGPMRPIMVIDLDRLDQNISHIQSSMHATKPAKHYRVVAKSIPSIDMIEYVMQKSGTKRLMAFHQPFLNAHARRFPDADILLGKPMPVKAAALFYRQHQGAFNPAEQLQWLIDTPERLVQYLEMAKGQGISLGVNIELDVGLHRGGVTAGPELQEILKLISENPASLRFTGFMGYDPHVVKVPGLIASRETLFNKAMDIYSSAVDQVRAEYAGLWKPGLTLNTAGSPTYQLHESETVCNDIAVGSALVKPTDFDIDTLESHLPAAYIATPVLKKTGTVAIPGLDGNSRLLSWWDINQRESYFLYGGYWKARLHAPEGLQNQPLYGRSTNQELVTGSPATGLSVDDHVFLRPTQSEFVFLQFGDLVAVRGGKIVSTWPVLGQTG